MQPFASLGRRGQVGRLGRLGRSALARYGLEDARLTLLRHEHNTTFRVDAGGGPWVLRLNRTGVSSPATIDSEMAWLTALRRETDLGAPEPVAARDGSLVIVAHDAGVPEPRACVLLRWLEGRFVDERLAPRHLGEVAELMAGLQRHAVGWTPPDGFTRPRVDTLTSISKRASTVPSAETAYPGEHPSREDARGSLRLVAALTSAADVAVFSAALDVVRFTTRELQAQPGTLGLIHGDLHQENYLFHGGTARAIDFDDCGWGFYLYDVAVPLSELEGRAQYDRLHAALLDGYARLRPLPPRFEAHLKAFAILRRMQILLWILESREHAAFRDHWQPWARKELRGLAAALDARP